uniref:Uncharacterized protein n=1 Tax=Leptospirillum ferrodiazotrophum TaxID=412449 RepID=C6HXV3_9BACT|nr:MAG: hypothetical protein UBAL3_93200067 [Leptospirillum ferrodiazotrophum]
MTADLVWQFWVGLAWPERECPRHPMGGFFEGSWNAPWEKGGHTVLLSVTESHRNVQNIFLVENGGRPVSPAPGLSGDPCRGTRPKICRSPLR